MRALMRAHPLTTLVTQCDSGLVANHVPVQTLDTPNPLGGILGHVARANPLWREYLSETHLLAVFHKPQGYIFPPFYPSKAQSVPIRTTQHFAAVDARSTLRV